MTIFVYLLAIFSAKLVASNLDQEQDTKEDELYLIRHKGSSYVLDGLNPDQVIIEDFTGFSSQFWEFQRANRADLFYIINNKTKTVLDIYYKNETNHWMVKLNELNETSTTQEWFLDSTHRICNFNTSLYIDVAIENPFGYAAGNAIGLDEFMNLTGRQIFKLQMKE